jgi:hypothetical protein
MENYDRRRREAQQEPGQRQRSPSGYEDERESWRQGSRDDSQRYGSPDYGARERDESSREQRYGSGRENQYGSGQSGQHGQRGQYGEDEDRERQRFSPDWSREGSEPRQSDEPYYARNRDRGSRSDTARSDWPYESAGRGGQGERSREDDSASYYRGYYRSSSTPFSYPGGRGELFAESWTLTGPYTGRGPKGYKRSDQQIIEDACQRLERDGEVDASEIEVTAEDGVIRLRGTVQDRKTKRRAEECVESVYGARDVMNELRVASQGQSQGQDQDESESGRSSQRTRSARGSASSSATTPQSSSGSSSEDKQPAPKH